MNSFEKNVKNIVLFLILALYIITLLFPAFKSVPRVPNTSFYTPFWFIALFIIYPKVFLRLEFFAAFPFILVHIFYLVIDNYAGLNAKFTETQLDTFVGVFFGTSAWAYLNAHKDDKRLKILALITILCISFTCLTTIRTLLSNPYAVRSLVGNYNPIEVLFLLRSNVGGYQFIYTLVFLSPLFLYFYRLHKKVIWIVLFILTGITIVMAQIVAAIGLYLLHLLLMLFLLRNSSIIRLTIGYLIIALVALLGKSLLIIFLNIGIELTKDNYDQISTKIGEVLTVVESGENRIRVREGEFSSINEYRIRYEKSKAGFFENPMTGGNPSGAHHFWIDNLCEHGILGTFTWIIVFAFFIYSARKSFLRSERIILINLVFIFIIIGIGKNITVENMPFTLFFIPSLILYCFGRNKIL